MTTGQLNQFVQAVLAARRGSTAPRLYSPLEEAYYRSLRGGVLLSQGIRWQRPEDVQYIASVFTACMYRGVLRILIIKKLLYIVPYRTPICQRLKRRLRQYAYMRSNLTNIFD